MSKIIISDDQNTVDVDGEKYVAETEKEFGACTGCAFDEFLSCENVPCHWSVRRDRGDVIFKLQK